MSVPAAEIPVLATLLPALLAAFGGSLHCAAMCGPIRMLTGQTTRARLLYQGGRGISYALLGASAGWLGWSLPLWALGILLALGLTSLWWPPLPKWITGPRARLLARASHRPFLLGLGSALLPCGMLHAWILVAAAASTPWSGALILGALWLGTLPALELGSWVISGPLRAARRQFPRVTAGLVLALALAPVFWRVQLARTNPDAPATCHGHGHTHAPAPAAKPPR